MGPVIGAITATAACCYRLRSVGLAKLIEKATSREARSLPAPGLHLHQADLASTAVALALRWCFM
jgi:hypothetical protein